MSSFFPWMGGKSRLAARMAAILPEHRCYVELFAGAANLLFAKERSKTEVINDINSDLVNLFRVVRWHPREFIAELRLGLHSRQAFTDYRAQPGLTDIQRAARTWFILKTAFGGRGGTDSPAFGYGTTGRAHFRRSVFAAIRRCHRRLDGVYVEHLDFSECIRRYDRPHTCFYCDPPYLDAAEYVNHFDIEKHRALAAQLRDIEGGFLVSINNHPKVRQMYKGFTMRTVPVKYSVSRDKSPKARDRKELVIANYPLPVRW